MANSNSPADRRRLAAGLAVALGVGLLIAGLLVTIQQAAMLQPVRAGSAIDLAHLLRMTVIQAGLTTLLSVSIGIAAAWALDRLRFPGRGLVVALFASALVTPGLVVAAGLLAVWGRSGWINAALDPLGLQTGSIFGLGGILAAHVVLDATLAARLFLARLETVPAARLKTGQSLGFGAARRFALIDWPAIAGSVPGVAALVFLLAFTSFPVVLLLGGGPANQTLEVAIYTAVRLDFDLAGAVRLALVQLAVCALIVIPASGFAPAATAIGAERRPKWQDGAAATALQALVLALLTIAFGLPLAGVLLEGIGPGLVELAAAPSFWRAAATSLFVGVASATLALAAGLLVTLARSAAPGRGLRLVLGLPAYAYLAVPAVTLSLGFFLAARALGLRAETAAPGVLVLANALLTLPFAIATLGPAADAVARRYGRLSRSLGVSGWRRWRLVEWPLLARETGIVLALGFCFSLGDLGVIALFGTEDFATLPWLMVRARGAYRTDDAAAIAALLLVVAIAAFWLIPKLFARWSRAEA